MDAVQGAADTQVTAAFVISQRQEAGKGADMADIRVALSCSFTSMTTGRMRSELAH
jgi:hypothetical protein